MTNQEVRLANLKILVGEKGSAAAVASLCDTAPTHLNALLRGDLLPSGKPRSLGDELARKLETGCGKPSGWMDQDHSESAITPEEVAQAFINGSPEKQEVIKLMARLPDNEAAMLLPIVRSVLAKYE